jgi:hypothetical protein
MLGENTREALGSANYTLTTTSGFHPNSGVRGYHPKDLWFGVYPTANGDEFAGNPQLFAIASGRGLEYGFGACTHPSDFSNQPIKVKVRAVAPQIFAQLPEPGSQDARALAERLEKSGGWKFRRKARLTPNETDFASLDEWLNFMRSPEGKKEAGGGIYRYLVGDEIDHADLERELADVVDIFRPLMERIRPIAEASKPAPEAPRGSELPSFASLMTDALQKFEIAKQGPFSSSEPVWSAMEAVASKVRQLGPIVSRPNLIVKWSVGKGVWSKIPWIAILDSRVTTTTQQGTYVVFLVSEDLARLYLNLAQGVTEYLNQLPAAAAAQALEQKAADARAKVPRLAAAGFALDNQVDLRSTGTLAKSYEKGTIAHQSFASDALPSDGDLSAQLEQVIAAYEAVIEEAVEIAEPEFEPELAAEPFSIDDAMDGLFMDRAVFEKILAVWRSKKNIVLQGAPGVGKSFVARRLAYAFLQAKDPRRVETIQFHQSYGYEDFVQGYRPTDEGGFKRQDGTFFRFCQAAASDPERDYVFIIDEINRGNLSKVFGELMLLIEPDKRSSEWAARLAYSEENELRFFVPPNLHIIGMMNTADRSLSMVDYALRRRFSFFDLEPGFSSAAFGGHLGSQQISADVIEKIVTRMNALNAAIEADKVNLGPGFRIGHSFFVPASAIADSERWYRDVVETEIYPLLREYWFDDHATADGWYAQLIS